MEKKEAKPQKSFCENEEAEKFARSIRNKISAIIADNHGLGKKAITTMEKATEDFKRYYLALPPEARIDFKKSISLALVSSLNEMDSVFSVGTILLLAAATDTRSVLPAILQSIESGCLLRYQPKVAKEIMNYFAGLAACWSDKEHTCAILRKLAENRYFECEKSTFYLAALCAVEPDGFSEHMDLLRKKFTEYFAKHGIQNAYIAAKIIRSKLGSERLSAYSYKPGDEWLQTALAAIS